MHLLPSYKNTQSYKVFLYDYLSKWLYRLDIEYVIYQLCVHLYSDNNIDAYFRYTMYDNIISSHPCRRSSLIILASSAFFTDVAKEWAIWSGVDADLAEVILI